MKIGLLEDQLDVAEAIARTLEKNGFGCTIFTDGGRLKRFMRQDAPDMLILDWNVPGESGLDILKWAKSHHPKMPALMLTGRAGPEDIISAFQAGANEYMLKPLDPNTLVARIKAMERLVFTESVKRIERFGRFEFNVSLGILTIDDKQIELTSKEFSLALVLFKNHGRTLSRDYLYETVWESNPHLETRSLDVHISKLRSKAKLVAENGCRIRPIYAYGYRLELEQGDP